MTDLDRSRVPGRSPGPRWEIPALVGILALALLLRALRLGWHDAWADEGFSLWVASLDFSSMATILRVDAHPPLYYLLLKAWCSVAPCDATNPGWAAVARLPSVLAGLGTVWGTWWLGRAVAGPGSALAAAAMMAVSESAVMMDQEIRMYAYLSLFCVLAHGAFVRLCWPPSGQRWPLVVAYVVVLILAFHTQYLGLLLLPVHLAGALLGPRDRRRVVFAAWGGALLAFVPWVLLFFRFQVGAGAGPPHAPPGPYDVPWALFSLVGGLSAPLPVPPQAVFWGLFVLVAAPAMLALRGPGGSEAAAETRAGSPGEASSPRPTQVVFLALAVALPMAIAWLASVLAPIHFFTPKYFGFILPPFFVLTMTGIATTWRRGRPARALQWLTVLSGIVILTLNTQALLQWNEEPGWQKSRWKDAITLLSAEYRAGDVVLVMNSYQQYVVERYLEQFLGTSRPSVLYIRRDLAASDKDLESVVGPRLRAGGRAWLLLCHARQVDPDARVVQWMGTKGTWERELVLPIGTTVRAGAGPFNRAQMEAGVVILVLRPSAAQEEKGPDSSRRGS